MLILGFANKRVKVEFVLRILAIKIAPDQITNFRCHKCLFKSVQLNIRSSLLPVFEVYLPQYMDSR